MLGARVPITSGSNSSSELARNSTFALQIGVPAHGPSEKKLLLPVDTRSPGGLNHDPSGLYFRSLTAGKFEVEYEEMSSGALLRFSQVLGVQGHPQNVQGAKS